MQARALDKWLGTVDLLGIWTQMSAYVSFAILVVYRCALFQARSRIVDAPQQSVGKEENDKLNADTQIK